MRPRLLAILSALSLLLSLPLTALWLRSLTHFELVTARYNAWPTPNEVRTTFLSFSWYRNTLRLELVRTIHPATHFNRPETLSNFRSSRPPSLHLDFTGEPTTLEMNGYPPGFRARYYPYRNTGAPTATGHRVSLSTRPWLPTLLTAILPTLYLRQYLKSRHRARHPNLCPTCNYDLRATPTRCPECGTTRVHANPEQIANLS